MSRLLLALLLAGCARERLPSTPLPPGETYYSPAGVEVYCPDADTAFLPEIYARVDAMPVEWYPSAPEGQRGLPSGWTWVLMGEGPFLVDGALASGFVDYGTRRAFSSTYMTSGAHFRAHGLVYVPAGEHEAAHAWYGGADLHERQAKGE